MFKVDKELQAWGPNNQNNGAAKQRWGREREQTSSGCPVFSLLLIPVLSETPCLVLREGGMLCLLLARGLVQLLLSGSHVVDD